MNPLCLLSFSSFKKQAIVEYSKNKGRQYSEWNTERLSRRLFRYVRYARDTYSFGSWERNIRLPHRIFLCYCCCVFATRSCLTERAHPSILLVYLNGIASRLRQYSVNNQTIYNAEERKKKTVFFFYHNPRSKSIKTRNLII